MKDNFVSKTEIADLSEEVKNPSITQEVLEQKFYTQCPICGILCKTKESYLKHTARKHLKMAVK